jgi:hypothetical protein
MYRDAEYLRVKREVVLDDGSMYLLPPLKPTDQVWQRHESKKLQWWENHLVMDISKLTSKEKDDFIIEEMRRRIEGYWFMNNGIPTYITGHHYFYLQYCRFPFGYPEYRDVDRRWFYFWDMAEKNPSCLGVVRVKYRRLGATSQGEAISLNKATSGANRMCGIVSKDNISASKCFEETVFLFQNLPKYAQPPLESNSAPKTKLMFNPPAKKIGKDGAMNTHQDGLNSMIDYRATTENAYDGTKQFFTLFDEFGKLKDISASTAWDIHKLCFKVGAKVVGKAYMPSTVNDMEKGGASYYDIYQQSDREELDLNGQTESGLWRYFSPAYDGFEGFIDRYGNSVIETPTEEQTEYIGYKIGSKEYLLNTRNNMRDEQSLLQEKRNLPFTISEAFYSKKAGNPFDSLKLSQQAKHIEETLQQNRNAVIKGNFEWLNENNGTVIFIPNEDGRFYTSYLPQETNQYYIENGKKCPKNYTDGIIGCDPVDSRLVTGSRGSNYAALGFRYLDPFNQKGSNSFFLMYCNRLPEPDTMHEDILKACIFYGMPLLAERAKNAVMYYFANKGYEGYIMSRPEQLETKWSIGKKQDWGLPTASQEVKSTLVGYLTTYIYLNMGEVEGSTHKNNTLFKTLIDEWINFEPFNWTDYDLSVASMMCLAAARRELKKPAEKKSIKHFNIKSR